jgi:hypothetical protein
VGLINGQRVEFSPKLPCRAFSARVVLDIYKVARYRLAHVCRNFFEIPVASNR